ncbi:MAG: site-specific DNA-methyltransferase [Planctomycetota bacterium]
MSEHRVIFGDSRRMPELPDESVHLVVTSPPYWCIKDYDHPAQVGHDQSYEDYLSDLQRVLSGCHRVLHPGCRAAVNIGDQYLRASEHGRYRVKPIPADVTRMGRDIGFDFMGSIIWRKISTTETTGGGCWMGSVYYPKDGHVTYEHEYILLFRKRGDWPRPTEEQKEKSRLTKRQRSEWFRGVWELQPARQVGHVAQFPVDLPRRLIKMYSFAGETVLDPFLGSGTTLLAADLEGRYGVGYEVNPGLEDTIRRKMKAEDLFAQRAGLQVENRADDSGGSGEGGGN